MIKVTLVADSIANGIRLSTFELVYPRYIHSELMTHRVFSRNASSSRAIPTNRLIEQVRNDPVLPIEWGKNKPGMQHSQLINDKDMAYAKYLWTSVANYAADRADKLNMQQVHKQFVNRILEPFTHIRVVVTATQFTNFFALRVHPDAQPEIRELATQMKDALEYNEPSELKPGSWHLPYIRTEDCIEAAKVAGTDNRNMVLQVLLKVSTARCARVSYNNFDGKPSTIQEDFDLFNNKLVSHPLHASPLEHQATPMREMTSNINQPFIPETWEDGISHVTRDGTLYSGNFCGWIQHRKLMPNECL